VQASVALFTHPHSDCLFSLLLQHAALLLWQLALMAAMTNSDLVLHPLHPRCDIVTLTSWRPQRWGMAWCGQKRTRGRGQFLTHFCGRPLWMMTPYGQSVNHIFLT